MITFGVDDVVPATEALPTRDITHLRTGRLADLER